MSFVYLRFFKLDFRIERMHLTRINLLALLLTWHCTLTVPIRAQEPPAGEEPPASSAEVYRQVLETAREDGRIDSSEQALLNSLQASLGLPNVEVPRLSGEPEVVPTLDQSGRWPLMAQNMVYGASLYGWMIPYVLEVEDFKWYVGMEMMSLGAAYYLTYRYTKDMNIPHARSQMMRAGSVVGLRYGVAINTLLELDAVGSKTWAWVLMASVPAGIYAGDLLFHRWEPSNGQSWSLTLWGEIGAHITRQIHHFFEPEPREPVWDADCHWAYSPDICEEITEYQQWEWDHSPWRKTNLVFEMAGYPAGVWFGQRFFGRRQYTLGDALMLIQGRSLGWMYGGMGADILGIDFDSPAGRIARTLGTVGGTLLMDRFIGGRDYTFGQAILSVLGTGSGMAFGVGLAAIVEVDDSETLEAMIMAGGLAGLLLSNTIIQPLPESLPRAASGRLSLTLLPSLQLGPGPPAGGRTSRRNSSAPWRNLSANRLTLIPGLTVLIQF